MGPQTIIRVLIPLNGLGVVGQPHFLTGHEDDGWERTGLVRVGFQDGAADQDGGAGAAGGLLIGQPQEQAFQAVAVGGNLLRARTKRQLLGGNGRHGRAGILRRSGGQEMLIPGQFFSNQAVVLFFPGAEE